MTHHHPAIITAGLRALDRYQREQEAKTIDLDRMDYWPAPDDDTPPPSSAAPAEVRV